MSGPQPSSEESTSPSTILRTGSGSSKRKKRGALRVMLLSGPFEVRGSSTQTLMLTEQLAQYGVEAFIVTPDINSASPERKAKLKIGEYPYLKVPVVNRLVRRFIYQDYQAAPPDLIHVQSRLMHADAIALSRRFGCPYVMTVHDYLRPGEMLSLDSTYGKKIIAVSESVKSELLTQPSLTTDDVVVIHSGVDVASSDSTHAILDQNRTPVIGTAGPLESMKGISFFIQAAQLVKQQYPHIEYLVVGTGPEEKMLRQLTYSLGMQKQITFVPNLYSFREVMKAMDIFCMPSIKQGLGTIMLEAMAWGLPVVASGVGGICSTIDDGETGLLVPHSDSQAIADKLCYLLQNPEQARQIGKAAQEHVAKNFRIDQCVGQIVDLYRSTLNQFSDKISA